MLKFSLGLSMAHNGILALSDQVSDELSAVIIKLTTILLKSVNKWPEALKVFGDEVIQAFLFLVIFINEFGLFPAEMKIWCISIEEDGKNLINHHHFVDFFH